DPRLELVTPASLGVVTFRRAGHRGEAPAAADRRHERILSALAAARGVLLTGTTLRSRYAIRLCILNHTSAIEDVAYALERVASVVVDDSADAEEPQLERAAIQAGIAIDWLPGPPPAPSDTPPGAVCGPVRADP